MHKALARDIQITETLLGPPITKEERHFAEMVEEICLLLAFPGTKTHSGVLKKKDSFTYSVFPFRFGQCNGKLQVFHLKILKTTTFLVTLVLRGISLILENFVLKIKLP